MRAGFYSEANFLYELPIWVPRVNSFYTSSSYSYDRWGTFRAIDLSHDNKTTKQLKVVLVGFRWPFMKEFAMNPMNINYFRSHEEEENRL